VRPPAPPRRPAEARAEASPVQVAAPAAFELPAAPAAPASNPFLLPVEPPPAPPALPVEPRVIPPAAGAPLAARPGGVAPSIRDPHAEFRRGTWKRPAAFAVGAAALVAGLFVLLPAEEPAPPLSGAEQLRPARGVIGGSLPPGRHTEDEPSTAEDQKQAFNETEQAARAREEGGGEAPERPADIPSEREFADAFKSAAR
jgi:hypothetical protein